jgi:two-component system nitrogen regulation response regulator NtrX
LLDVWLPGIDGLEVLKRLKKVKPLLPVVIMSGHGTIETAVKATKLGAFDFLEKPLSLDKLLIITQNALKLKKLEKENIDLKGQLGERYQLVGASREIEEVRAKIAQVAPTNTRVLIRGDNGTGKEVVAREIHKQSERAAGPFIKVNCAAIPRELIESELFGHVKGAFTGAVESVPGKFELADAGTIFLDEIGDMSLSAQAKVLRVIEEQEFERVGGRQTIKVDVRILAATNQDLERLIKQGAFRSDLYYRLNVFPLFVPPLREHIEDVRPLAEHFIRLLSYENNRPPRHFTPEAIKALENHAGAWPGNIRELRNTIERLVIAGNPDDITAEEVVAAIGETAYISRRPDELPADYYSEDLKTAMENFERKLIERRIEACDGNISRTAEELGLERSHLYKKMKSLGIDRKK